MRIVNLIENTKGSKECLFEHGLSFYIETKNYKLLVDAGQTDAILTNANILDVNLQEVDIVILSHGHYDHSGGILPFSKLNPKARIIMQQSALGDYYNISSGNEKYIGIDKEIIKLEQVELISGDVKLSGELFVFSGVTGRRMWPRGNKHLAEKKKDSFVQDEFIHEQYLVVEEDDKSILISGCAHNGLLNILERYREIFGDDPDVVISGFHMKKVSDYTEEELDSIRSTAGELMNLKTTFYTGHCTGEIPYNEMKKIMGDKLIYVHSGDEIIL